MARRILIVDIRQDFVACGVFSERRKRLTPVVLHTAPFHGSNMEEISTTLSSMLDYLKERGYRDFSRVFLSLPPRALSLRVVELPMDDPRKIEEVIPFEIGDLLLGDPSEMIISALQLHSSKVMAVAVEKEILRHYLEVFSSFGIDPSWVGTSLFSMRYLLQEDTHRAGNLGIVIGDTFTVLFEGKPVFYKDFYGKDELILIEGYLKKEGIYPDRLVATEENAGILREVFDGIDIEVLSLPGDVSLEYAGVTALARHIEHGLEGSVNLRKGEFGYTKEARALRRAVVTTGVLVGMIVLIGGVDFYLRYRELSEELSLYRKALTEEYMALFPKESRVPDALYQLRAKLMEMEKDLEILNRKKGVLDIMNSLARMDNLDVTFYELHAGERRVVAKGETDSFDSANRLRELLRGMDGIREVSLADVKAGTDGRTRFSVAMVLGGGND